MPRSAALLLICALPAAFAMFMQPMKGSGPPVDREGAPEKAPLMSAAELLQQPFSQRAIRSLFEWEHQRAFTYERFGEHKYYYDDPRIHNFGNSGWRGLLHACVVPVATHMIDRFAYSGTDARKLLHENVIPADATVVDLAAGVGFSAARNGKVTCVDTSTEMLTVARLRRPDVKHFEVGNAETWGETGSFDIATLMYATHEMPRRARIRAIRNCLRLARQSVLVVDIWPGFEPNDMMLSGEPYVLDYLANIEDDVNVAADPSEWVVTRVDVVEGHVRMWKFDRKVEA